MLVFVRNELVKVTEEGFRVEILMKTLEKTADLKFASKEVCNNYHTINCFRLVQLYLKELGVWDHYWRFPNCPRDLLKKGRVIPFGEVAPGDLELLLRKPEKSKTSKFSHVNIVGCRHTYGYAENDNIWSGFISYSEINPLPFSYRSCTYRKIYLRPSGAVW